MENLIIKDKLSGAYESMQNILYKQSESFYSNFFLEAISKHAKNLEITNEQLIKDYLDITLVKDDLRYRLSQVSEIKNLLTDQQDKLLIKARDKIARMKELNESLTEECEKLKSKLETIEFSHKILSDEYEKLRQRMKLAKFKQMENDEEKICKNCRSFFKEEENFNWSCKIHSSQYSEIWWCCGKKEKNAPGCKVCKHQSQEEYESIIKDDPILVKKGICSSCKHAGHSFANCPKDPNFKTSIDLYEEIERLAIVTEQKSIKENKQGDKGQFRSNTNFIRNERLKEFREQQYDSDCDEDERIQIGGDMHCDGFFEDLMELKGNTIFNTDDTRIKVTSDIGESPFMIRKMKTIRKSQIHGIKLTVPKDRVSTLFKTITMIE